MANEKFNYIRRIIYDEFNFPREREAEIFRNIRKRCRAATPICLGIMSWAPWNEIDLFGLSTSNTYPKNIIKEVLKGDYFDPIKFTNDDKSAEETTWYS